MSTIAANNHCLTFSRLVWLSASIALFGCLPKSKSSSGAPAAATAATDLSLNSAASDDRFGNSHRGGDDRPSKHCDTGIDPGPRQGLAAAGEPLPGLTTAQAAFFSNAITIFTEVDSVDGSLPDTGIGLGPTFNENSCAACHAYPAVGGSSPLVNPQVELATDAGGTNTVPSFISKNGPVREARFKFVTNPDGSVTTQPDGGVHALYTIAGRSDAQGCKLAQPDFNSAIRNNNIIFRIPTPTFGAGLIESISDDTILLSAAATANSRRRFGIGGVANRSGNDGTITRFGWKAQNKSVLIFAGEAYNVEQGVTNEAFPNERASQCNFNPTPEDHTNFDQTTALAVLSDIQNFDIFMRMLAPPTPAMPTTESQLGSTVFNKIGCNLCHTPSLAVSASSVDAISNQKNANLYSDLLVHHMGPRLADEVAQGGAGPDQFRSAPLWGLGQRLFFLHDGRTNNLVTAIEAHASRGNREFQDSEANEVIEQFEALPVNEQQALLAFLRSL